MNDTAVRPGHQYTVCIRFSGEQLDAARISTLLHLQPSHQRSQPEEHGVRKRHAFWAYDGHGEIGFRHEWESLEQGLRFLLGCLHARKAEIKLLSTQFKAYFWCGHFQSSFNGGPTLPPDLLIELGSYGVALSIDNYFSED